MSTFQLQAKNSSTKGWSFVLYQRQPKDQDGKEVITNLAWRVINLAKPQPHSPTIGSEKWSMEFMVTIPVEANGAYSINKTPGLFFPAKEGYKYTAASTGENTVITLLGPGDSGHITLTNATLAPLNLGISLSGALLAMKTEVSPGMTADFKILSNYYVGLFNNFKQGAIMSYKFAHGPNLIKFTDGYNVASVEAQFVNGQDVITSPAYSRSSTVQINLEF